MADSKSPYYLGLQDNPGLVMTPIVLKGDNYDEWAKAVKYAFRAKKKLAFLEGNVTKPGDDAGELEDWCSVNSMLVAWIFNTIEPGLRSTISYMETAKELWEDLRVWFAIGNDLRIHQLKSNLANCKQEGMTVSAYYGKMKTMWEELAGYVKNPQCTCGGCKCGAAIELTLEREKEKIHQFLMGLDSAVYEAVGFAVQTGNRTKSQNKDEKTCSHCGKIGHEVLECFQLVGYLDWWFTSKGGRSGGPGGRGGRGTGIGKGRGGSGSVAANAIQTPGNCGTSTTAATVRTSDKAGFPRLDDEQWATLMAMINSHKESTSEKLTGKKMWLIDSGCSHNMTGTLELLKNVHEIAPCAIGLPDGKNMMALQEGEDPTSRTVIGVGEKRDGVYLWLYVARTSACRAKQTRDVFPLSSNKASAPFALIHCDVWGPYRTPASCGAIYFLTIVDDYSRVVWIYLMAEKSEVGANIVKFCAMVMTQFDSKVRVIRSDNGSEFVALSNYCNIHGIIQQTSCVGTPQQNGRVERKHRHILNVARALRFHANLPGSDKDKFGSRSQRCIFVGYPFGKKGWRLYDLDTNEFFVSRDVVFSEHIFPYKAVVSESLNPGVAEQPSVCNNDAQFFDDHEANSAENSNDESTPEEDVTPEARGSGEDLNEQREGNVNLESNSEGKNLGRGCRERRPPEKLKDYICHTAQHINDPLADHATSYHSSGASYPITRYVTCTNFSLRHRQFLTAITAGKDPTYFSEAIRESHWRQAMKEEIEALERNGTWTLEPLPPGSEPSGANGYTRPSIFRWNDRKTQGKIGDFREQPEDQDRL
ncbi:PREDICTED: uncharacterized protein LOC104612388 [Nelumbo nucifera]|uniref:Uncharacterized protein LOC104612388 n=1 Tax=Nelumbo nucifera TaxID=4432 RepID=A0A1U8BDS9_NELNU|nr:PREDICTED: uncharacterized protein LOC104612388 [Nelumbo nucifera]